MIKLLNVVVCYNFPYYLKNTIDSLLDIFRAGDILIIDNGSDKEEMFDILDSFKKNNDRIEVLKRDHNDNKKKIGSLYEAYNYGIEYSIDNNYDLIQFIQDDLQFLWYEDGLLKKINQILKTPKTIMVSPLYQKKITRANIKSRFIKRDDLETWESIDNGLCDVGFMSVKCIKENNISFHSTETEHSIYYLKQGYKLQFLQNPFLAYIPWPAVRKMGKIIGKEHKPINKYYYYPLDLNMITQQKLISKNDIVYIEDFCIPWDYGCVSPYWYTTPNHMYIKLLIESKLKLSIKSMGKIKFFLPDIPLVYFMLIFSTLKKIKSIIYKSTLVPIKKITRFFLKK